MEKKKQKLNLHENMILIQENIKDIIMNLCKWGVLYLRLEVISLYTCSGKL